VIIGSDIIVRDGEIVIQPDQRARTDQSLKGYKKALKENPEAATRKAEAIIKNTYRTLMTRGQKGCYVYCVDPETNAYFSKMAELAIVEQEQAAHTEPLQSQWEEPQSEQYPGLTLKLLEPEDVKPYENAVPIFDLEIAALACPHALDSIRPGIRWNHRHG